MYVNSSDAPITMFGIGVSVSTSIALTDARCEKLTSVSCKDQYAITCWPSGAFVCSVRPLQDSYRVTVQKAFHAQAGGRVRVATLAMAASEASTYVAVASVLNALMSAAGRWPRTRTPLLWAPALDVSDAWRLDAAAARPARPPGPGLCAPPARLYPAWTSRTATSAGPSPSGTP